MRPRWPTLLCGAMILALPLWAATLWFLATHPRVTLTLTLFMLLIIILCAPFLLTRGVLLPALGRRDDSRTACAGCGYDLRGHSAGRCPECSMPMTPPPHLPGNRNT